MLAAFSLTLRPSYPTKKGASKEDKHFYGTSRYFCGKTFLFDHSKILSYPRSLINFRSVCLSLNLILKTCSLEPLKFMMGYLIIIYSRGGFTPSLLFLLWLRLYCHSSTKSFVEKKITKARSGSRREHWVFPTIGFFNFCHFIFYDFDEVQDKNLRKIQE